MTLKSILLNPTAFSSYSRFLSPTVGLCYAALRFLRLHILPQMTKWRKSYESPKVAVYKGRKFSALSALIHVIPFTASLALIIINLRRTYVGDTSPTTTTALQFTAKLVEITIQASLAAILLDLIRFQVLGPLPLPLGGFFAPYQITHVSYLWSMELWGSLTTTSLPRSRKILLAISIPSTVILAALVGPSSAVLMIPRSITSTTEKSLVLLVDKSLFFPSVIDLEGEDYSIADDLEKAVSQLIQGVETSPRDLSLQIKDDHSTRVIQRWKETSASTIPTQLAEMVFNAPDSANADFKEMTFLQPYVRTTCSSSETGSMGDKATVPFPDENANLQGRIPLSSILQNRTVSPLGAHLQMSILRTNTSVTMNWYEPPRSSNYSTIMVSVDPFVMDVTAPNGSQKMGLSVTGCTTSAWWENVSTNWTAGSRIVSSRFEHNDGLREPRGEIIILSPAWVKSLAEKFHLKVYQLSGGNSGLQSAAIALALSNVGLESQNTIPSFLPAYVLFNKTAMDRPDRDLGLDQMQYDIFIDRLKKLVNRNGYRGVIMWGPGQPNNSTAPGTQLHSDLQGYRKGIGFDSSTTAVQLSLTILIIYSMIVAGYLALMFVLGRSATSWDSIAEIMMLALNSKQPEHLKGTSVGIETLSTVREPVNIRVNYAGSLEMVFENDPGIKKESYSNVVPNVRY